MWMHLITELQNVETEIEKTKAKDKFTNIIGYFNFLDQWLEGN